MFFPNHDSICVHLWIQRPCLFPSRQFFFHISAFPHPTLVKLHIILVSSLDLYHLRCIGTCRYRNLIWQHVFSCSQSHHDSACCYCWIRFNSSHTRQRQISLHIATTHKKNHFTFHTKQQKISLSSWLLDPLPCSLFYSIYGATAGQQITWTSNFKYVFEILFVFEI